MQYYICSVFSFLISITVVPLVIKLSLRYGIFDRNHLGNGTKISRLGGIAVFLSFIIPIGVLISIRGEYQVYLSLIPLILLFFLGLYDDLFNLLPLIKLFCQFVIAILAIEYGGIVPFNNLIGSSFWNPICCNLLSVLFMVCMINAFNLIDGIDGLATILGILVVLFMAVGLLYYGDLPYAASAFIFCCTLTGFLFYNFSPAKIYLGDSGSMITGFIAVMLSFRLLELDREMSGYVSGNWAYLLALFMVPFYDTVRVFISRLLNRKSPFKGDRNHIHHRLRQLGWSDSQIVLALTSYTLFMVLLTFVFQGFTESLKMFILILTTILSNRVLSYKLQQEITGVRIDRNI
ncbi:UDP-N-acetylmuramyl pentapeptide phosphotransferase/UDP-N-acetylglucosamine-1-phosphate transferase [Pedobacter sp. CAN_A7]|uniref:glycosyltransferase family 4 protein n=1 Tax=Pedobacter sp. CAN_A7 TaxID=2787722 RepID=UPI0018CB374F